MRNENVGVQSLGRKHQASVARGSCLTTVAAALIVWCQVPSVFGGVEHNTYGNYHKGNEDISYRVSDSANSHVDYSYLSGSVGSGWTLADGESLVSTSGRADAANLKLGVGAWAVSTPKNNYFTDGSMSVKAANRFTIAPGTSGLALGETTTLTVNIRLDGGLHAKAVAWPEKSWAHADFSAGFSIHDDAIQIGDEEGGSWSPSLASFGASGELEAYDVYYPAWSRSYSSNWSESWSTESNLSPRQSHNDSGREDETGEAMHYEASRQIDTGLLTLSFSAIVGHTLDIDAYFNTYINVNNDGEVYSDFGNTLSFQVTPAMAGLELGWQIVPEPSSLSLLALGGLALLRRKRA